MSIVCGVVSLELVRGVSLPGPLGGKKIGNAAARVDISAVMSCRASSLLPINLGRRCSFQVAASVGTHGMQEPDEIPDRTVPRTTDARKCLVSGRLLRVAVLACKLEVRAMTTD